MDGITATAYAAYAMSDKLVINTIAKEDFEEELFSRGNNSFEAKTEVEFGVLSSSSEPGRLVSACVDTSSVVSMIPSLYRMARNEQTVVMHVPAGSVNHRSVG